MSMNNPASAAKAADAPAPASSPATTLNLPWWKKLLFTGVIAAAFVILAEGVTRVGFFVFDDFSPYYLTFGFVGDVERHSAEFDGYSKFQPNSTYHYKVSRDTTVAMRINNDGFRGKDHVRPKPAGSFRVVTLGESSTFGLTNQDNETYPVYLEERLKARVPGRQIDVYNLGIPHYRSNNILAVAKAELAALQPDVVTFYAGYNNAMNFRAPEQAGAAYQFKDWLKAHSVAYRALHPYVLTAVRKLSASTGRDVAGLPHLQLQVDLPPDRVAQLREQARDEYRRDLDSLLTLVRGMGATPVIVTQTYTLRMLPKFVAMGGPFRPYREELMYADSVLKADGKIPAPHSTILIHHDIIEVQRELARKHGIPVIEGIAALDTEREKVMSSYVHLTKEGNVRLSAAIDSGLVAAGLVPGAKVPAKAKR